MHLTADRPRPNLSSLARGIIGVWQGAASVPMSTQRKRQCDVIMLRMGALLEVFSHLSALFAGFFKSAGSPLPRRIISRVTWTWLKRANSHGLTNDI